MSDILGDSEVRKLRAEIEKQTPPGRGFFYYNFPLNGPGDGGGNFIAVGSVQQVKQALRHALRCLEEDGNIGPTPSNN